MNLITLGAMIFDLDMNRLDVVLENMKMIDKLCSTIRTDVIKWLFNFLLCYFLLFLLLFEKT